MQKTVTIRFDIRDKDGTKVGSSGQSPVRYQLGSGSLPATVERTLGTLIAGQKVQVPVAAAQAFGERDPRLSVRLAHSSLTGVPKLGSSISLATTQGEQYWGVITKVDDAGVIVDANHPLAGQDVVFDLSVIKVESPNLIAGFSKN